MFLKCIGISMYNNPFSVLCSTVRTPNLPQYERRILLIGIYTDFDNSEISLAIYHMMLQSPTRPLTDFDSSEISWVIYHIMLQSPLRSMTINAFEGPKLGAHTSKLRPCIRLYPTINYVLYTAQIKGPTIRAHTSYL